jgi:small subunit ribosomal protein S14
MARKSVRERELKKALLEQKYRAKYESIKSDLQACYVQLDNPKVDQQEVFDKIEHLDTRLQREIPRNATLKRKRNRCAMTGRSRGVYRKFKLSRSMLRKLAMMGLIPGIKKASW